MTDGDHSMHARSAAIIFYHSIGGRSSRFAISDAAFRNQIRYLRDSFPIIRLSDLRIALAQPRGDNPSVILTIDDGYVDFLEHGYPVLSELDVPSTVFVPTGLIGRTNEWDAGRGLPARPIMTERQLRDLATSPLVDLGSHSVTHCNLRNQSPAEVRRQVEDSKDALEQIVSRPVTMFAYPYGGFDSFSPATTLALQKAGYDVAVTTVWGTRHPVNEMLRLPRIFLSEQDSPDDIRRKITGRQDWRRTRQYAGHVLAPARRWADRIRARVHDSQ